MQRLRFLVGPLAISILVIAPTGAEAAQARIKVATSGGHSELVKRLPIARGGHANPRVVMSVPVKRVGGLIRGDDLAISAELQLTTDCEEPGPRCLGDPYHYNPRVTTYAVLAPDPGMTSGRRTSTLADAKPQTCRQSQPNREHHCVLVRESSARKVGAGAACLATRCFVNLVASAASPRAHRGEYMAVGGLRPNGAVPQDRGRLNLIRTSPSGTPDHRTLATDRLVSKNLALDQDRGSIVARRIGRLSRGDQLVVSAQARMDISRLPYNVVFSSQLIVTDRRGDVLRGDTASFVSSRGELGEGNGFNCTQNKGSCTIRKVGVLNVDKTPMTKAGRPIPLFISLVTRAGPKQLEARPGDRVRVAATRLRANVYPNRVRLEREKSR